MPIRPSAVPASMSVRSRVLIALLLLAALGFGATSYAYYKKTKQIERSSQKVSQDATQETVNELTAKVSRLILLPTDETPTIATVADLSKLKDQPFFVKAQVGDKVLIYTKARKAFLYSPTQDMIVEVAPLTVGQAASVSTTIDTELKKK